MKICAATQPPNCVPPSPGWSIAIRTPSSRKPVSAITKQDPDEGPVAEPVDPAIELRLARRAVGARVVELARARDRAPDHHHEQAGDQRRPEHVQHLLVGEVERAVEVVPAEHRVGEVGVEAEDHRAREQRDEAVEDRPACARPAVRSRRAIVRCASSVRSPPTRRRPSSRAAATARRAPAVLGDRPRDAVEEDEHRRDRRARTRGPSAR